MVEKQYQYPSDPPYPKILIIKKNKIIIPR